MRTGARSICRALWILCIGGAIVVHLGISFAAIDRIAQLDEITSVALGTAVGVAFVAGVVAATGLFAIIDVGLSGGNR